MVVTKYLKLFFFKKGYITILKEFVAYFCYYFLFTKKEQIRVVIFAQGRTGSSLLEDLIYSAGYFQKNRELLSSENKPLKLKILQPHKYIIGLAKLTPKNFIFHSKIYHLKKTDPHTFLKKLEENNWKIIYLRRRNKVNHALSNIILESRGKFHKFDDNKEDLRITVNCNELVSKVKQRFKYEKLEREALKNLNYIEVIYEEDLEKQEFHQKTAEKIFKFIGIENIKVKTKFKKVNQFTNEELIINYEEFYNCVKENNLEEYLNG